MDWRTVHMTDLNVLYGTILVMRGMEGWFVASGHLLAHDLAEKDILSGIDECLQLGHWYWG
jgi:hypothetical protein